MLQEWETRWPAGAENSKGMRVEMMTGLCYTGVQW